MPRYRTGRRCSTPSEELVGLPSRARPDDNELTFKFLEQVAHNVAGRVRHTTARARMNVGRRGTTKGRIGSPDCGLRGLKNCPVRRKTLGLRALWCDLSGQIVSCKLRRCGKMCFEASR